ncbi:hypothetical protein U0070_010518, partial [Myodes glareolus]
MERNVHLLFILVVVEEAGESGLGKLNLGQQEEPSLYPTAVCEDAIALGACDHYGKQQGQGKGLSPENGEVRQPE